MIALTNVTKRYREFTAVHELNLRVHAGEIVGVIGHNDAGKNTPLKMIAGLVAPTAGAIRVLGRDLQKDSVFQIVFKADAPLDFERRADHYVKLMSV